MCDRMFQRRIIQKNFYVACLTGLYNIMNVIKNSLTRVPYFMFNFYVLGVKITRSVTLRGKRNGKILRVTS
jgi:hypothetical protein